jgi:hypothetical protein
MVKSWIIVVVSVAAIFLPGVLLFHIDNYPRAPYDVAYRDQDSLMGVTCMNGHVFI